MNRANENRDQDRMCFISSVKIWVQTCLCVCVYDYLTYFFSVCKSVFVKGQDNVTHQTSDWSWK